MRVLRVVPLLAFAGALHLVVPSAGTASALPTSFSISPRVTVSSVPVHAQGGGCSSAVQFVVTGFLLPGGPAILVDQSIAVDVAGNWSFDFPMPSMPAYAVASCDGGSTQPIVIAPSNVGAGMMSYAGLTNTEVQIATSPLVDGSELAVFNLAGTLLGSSVVVGGSATVSLPRALGPATVLAVGLRQQDPGIALPYVPIAQLVQLPLSASSEMQVNPRVGAPGTTITVSGACAGTPRVVIAGRPGGWYDVPPVYADVVALPSNGPFSLTAPMPVLPSTVRLLCTSGGVTEIVQQLISPATGDLVPLVATVEGSGYLVGIPSTVSPEVLAAFGLTGDAVPLSVFATSAVVTVRLEPPVGVSDVVIVGLETLGENAEALQNVRVQGWTVHLSGAIATTSTTSTAPTTSTGAPTDPSVTGEPGGPTSSQPTPSVPGAASAVLPSTGVSSNQTSVAAIVCILVGLLAVALARGRVSRGPKWPAKS